MIVSKDLITILNNFTLFMENKEIKTYRLIIKGKVQNVGFRHWFSDLAISLGLNGYVQNKESKDLDNHYTSSHQ